MKNIEKDVHREKGNRGNATIEAALLMPVLLAAVLLVIYLSFFLYNREAMTTIAYTAALKGAQMEQEEKNQIQKEITEYVKEECEKLLFVSRVEHSVKVTTGNVKVHMKLVQKTPFQPMLEQIGAAYTFSCEVEKAVERIHPASIIWDMRRTVKK